jgi:hypothetical protein
VKDTVDVDTIIPMLLKVGYMPKNIHLIWVLTNYEVAFKANKERERVVPDDIMISSHKGAAKTMVDIVNGRENYTINPKRLWGEIHVILGNRENTIWFTDQDTKETITNRAQSAGKKLGRDVVNKKTGEKEFIGIVKSFTSLKMKDSGKPIKNDSEVRKQLFNWVKNNVPIDVVKELF